MKAKMNKGSFRSVVCIVKRNKHYLFCKREDNGLWTLPGGRVEAGENPEKAALRELFEESRASIGKHIRKEKENYNLKKPKEVEAITGCSMFIPKNTIEKIGLFDEKFFMYGEDIDYSLRMKKEGFRMYIIPNTTVYHDVSIENEQNTSNLKKSIMKIYNYTLSNYINIIKHFSLTYLAIWSIRLPIVAIYELIKRKTK